MIKNCFFLILILFIISSCGVRRSLKDRPDLSNYHSQSYVRHQVNDSLFYIDNNFLKKNKNCNGIVAYSDKDAIDFFKDL